MYKFEDPNYLNETKAKLEKEHELVIPSYVWESIIMLAGDNAHDTLADEKLGFENNIELYEQYFSDTLEQTDKQLIIDTIEFYQKH